MHGYHVALYIHLLALVAASATASVVHLGHGRAHRAGTVAEIRQWLWLAGRTARVFPVATLTLFLTGAWMVALGGFWSWSTGWVEAGVLGVVWLFASGPVLGKRGARTGRALAALKPGELDRARALIHDPVAGALSWINTGVALGVVFAMAVKPELAGSLAALFVGAATGYAVSVTEYRKAGAAPVAESQELAA